MKNSEISQMQDLLRIARKNLALSGAQLNTVSWAPEILGISSSLRGIMLALDQTINALDRVFEDLK